MAGKELLGRAGGERCAVCAIAPTTFPHFPPPPIGVAKQASATTQVTLGDKTQPRLVYRPTLNISTKVNLFSITVLYCPYL